MFPRYFRWISGVGVIGAVVVFMIACLNIWIGTAPTTDLIQPVVTAFLFGFMFNQSTKA